MWRTAAWWAQAVDWSTGRRSRWSLIPSSPGWRVRWRTGKRTVTGGWGESTWVSSTCSRWRNAGWERPPDVEVWLTRTAKTCHIRYVTVGRADLWGCQVRRSWKGIPAQTAFWLKTFRDSQSDQPFHWKYAAASSVSGPAGGTSQFQIVFRMTVMQQYRLDSLTVQMQCTVRQSYWSWTVYSQCTMGQSWQYRAGKSTVTPDIKTHAEI